MIDTYPQRTRWEIPDSKIVFDSNFCSGNLARAQRGYQKNTFDLWVAHDAAPHMEGDYYKTWFYFSVTGIPQGELITFTFKNLNNQVRSHFRFCNQTNKLIIRLEQTVQSRSQTGI